MGRRARVQFALLAAGCGLLALRMAAGVDFGPLNTFTDRWLYSLVELSAMLLAVHRAATRPENRRGWALLAGYLALWGLGDLGWSLHYDFSDAPPFPNWTDGAYLLSYLPAYAGLVALMRPAGPVRAALWLDGLVVGLTLAAICAALFLGPVLDAPGSGGGKVVTLAYPALDLVLVALVGVAIGLTGWRPGRAWLLLGLGLAVAAVGDAAYSYEVAVGSYTELSWTNLTWPLAMVLLAAAGHSPEPRRARASVEPGIVVPAVAALVALMLLLTGRPLDVPVAAGVLAALALVAGLARTVLTHAELTALLRRSRTEALTDGLTALGNRRRLMLDLDDALAASGTDGPTTLVFFDLDGFKAYNDTFGHGAGDALLVRVATALAAAVDGAGAAYRLGGDEFCVLLRGDVPDDDPWLVRATQALTEHGEGFSIGSSRGVVRLPADAPSSTLALQLADERMYADKDSRRGSSRRQARDLLLQILREREPELEEHVDDVGSLAVAVGRELALSGEALDVIARGAELHDIGKIAVPEAILHKPGPLDELEWQVMRQHTIIGERILAAAPALRPVAELVRSSHERWDGRGYPDGLAGDAIPLGARVIAVCDAFDAMRQDRPYAGPMTEAEALAEIRRCAGTQFDPLVVDAFALALARGAGDELRVA